MKKVFKSVVTAAMAVSMLAGCGTAAQPAADAATESATSAATEASEEAATEAKAGDASTTKAADLSGTELEIATYLSGDTLEAYKKIIEGFEKETGAKITLDEYGNDYEATLKTRMASNDLPDIFETHGWSLIRYKEYLKDLSNEPWAGDLSKAARGVIEDTDGKIYTLMTTGSCLGLAVNMDVCEAAGVDPWKIETWEDFNTACDKIKKAGYTAIGNYFTSAGALANCDGSWLTYEGEQFDDGAAMLNGTWDWKDYKAVLDYLQTWFDNGYLYEDAGTIAQSDVIERCAKDDVAFVVGIGTSFQAAVTALNPDVKMAMIPIPASKEGGARFVGIGEGASFGIWKDTENMEAAEQFLAYIVKNADGINAAAGEISTLPTETTKSYGMQMMEEMESHYPDVFYDNLWDRKYMPSGMWSIFQTAAGMFYEDQSEESKQEIIEYLKENYTDLFEAAQE